MTDKTTQGRKAPQPPTRRKTSSTSRVFYLDMFALELARGGAHIASALSTESRTAAMHGVIGDFTRKHGTEDLGVFLGMLVARLEARLAYAGAEVVSDYAAKQTAILASQVQPCDACGVEP